MLVQENTKNPTMCISKTHNVTSKYTIEKIIELINIFYINSEFKSHKTHFKEMGKNVAFIYIITATKHLAKLLIYLLAYKLQLELKIMCNNI
jgi:hypothetical protein